MNLYVKKLTSLNPDRHKKMELWKAISQYEDYIRNYVTAPYTSNKSNVDFKSFKEWLKTEI